MKTNAVRGFNWLSKQTLQLAIHSRIKRLNLARGFADADSLARVSTRSWGGLWACGILCLSALVVLAADSRISTGCIDNPFLKVTMSAATGRCEILDKSSGATWDGSGFGAVTLRIAGKPSRVVLKSCELLRPPQNSGFFAVFHPITNNPAALRVQFDYLPEARALQISYDTDPGLDIESFSPLPQLLEATRSGHGYVVVPAREGLLILADSGIAFTHRFDTYAYEGCHMEMLGVVQNRSAVLATWDDPYVAVDVRSTVRKGDWESEAQTVAAALVLTKTAKSFQLHFLGKEDYVGIAKAYREVAKRRGFFVNWDEKLKTNPERSKLFGAANIKLWSALDRRMNEESTKEESVRTNWTFKDVAELAEHLKRDLQLDRVLFALGGWIHRGYDNQHPDVLPTAPECGGDGAFSDCARRVMQQGYLFCLHDNYQDIYRDSPSWNERFVMKTPDGKLARGGHWAGGLAFLTCSRMAVELAQRPQNLPAVKELSRANAYFIDTTYAAGLQECFDPEHPLTRADDMRWKQALSDYARGVFGVFGSECGREWAIPHADFFEGLTGVSGRSYHDATLPDKLGAVVVPLFDLVYRECIAMYGKYGYDPKQAGQYVLQHISLARPLNYHSIPPHLYWKSAQSEEFTLDISPLEPEIVPLRTRQLQVTYRWRVQEPLASNWQAFVHFTDSAGTIKFQNNYRPNPPTSEWKPGNVSQGPFTVDIPQNIVGPVEVRTGLYDPATGTRARLKERRGQNRDYLIGKLIVLTNGIEFQPANTLPAPGPSLDVFTHAENGWAAGMNETDRFIKNTYEVLSPLNELTAKLPMTSHQFITPDRKIQRTTFGEGTAQVNVTVNLSDAECLCPCRFGGQLRLPPLGFLAEGPAFVAFYSLNWGGREFDEPALFTMRSTDGKSLSASRKIRVFHAFGDDKLRLGSNVVSVQREGLVDPKSR
ncbi:MAG TPA: DUF5696 domain-containing protein [Verrucomicrobiae bacterium]|nr:DUF5696 domain-containing protein [Verrucomicrobiae bacterium]